MQRILKTAAALIGTCMLALVSAAGFYETALPDIYNVSGSFTLHSALPISAVSGKTAAVEAGSGTSSSDMTLMLFGTVPIKDVKMNTVKRAYAVPVGEPIGLKLMSDGVMVIELQEVGGRCPAKEAGIEVGDVISKVAGEPVADNSDVSDIISKSGGQPCSVTLERDGERLELELEPELDKGSYKAGMWVRDSSAGIGTLTFYVRDTGAFAGLGHPVCDSDTKQTITLSQGSVGEIKLTGITKSESGSPGQLIGEFKNSASVGTILKNRSDGVYGTLDYDPASSSEALPIAFSHEVSTGEAAILCDIDGKGAKEYSVIIESADISGSSEHDMVIRVTDKKLIKKAGGIVQGMSGSPLIQNGRIVGAVTHVFVDDSTRGYAIFADTMYSQVTDIASDRQKG
ncbi:MAG: SpoIVB peptidase [Ruminococcus sp.]|nr:SpoIVB peptidase [Ruminococcus sp.]